MPFHKIGQNIECNGYPWDKGNGMEAHVACSNFEFSESEIASQGPI